jgi:L-asparaginase
VNAATPTEMPVNSPSAQELPRVVILALGGTIASAPADSGAPATVRLQIADLLTTVPGISTIAELEAHQIILVPSGDLRFSDVFNLRAFVTAALDSGASGVVVTQGTDTLEEAAYCLDLITDYEAPIVFTGAMRNGGLPGADGPANLTAAIRVAASPETRGVGVLVVMNDEIHSARLVRKRHTHSPATFGSPLAGPLGYVIEDRVRLLTRPVGRLNVPITRYVESAPVAQVMVGFDGDDRLIEAVPGLGYGGLVVAAFGGGHVPKAVGPALEQVCRSIPVVLASRTTTGEGLLSTYGYPGGEVDLVSRGLIPAAGLDPSHAAVLLRLLLMAGVDRDSFGQCFEAALHGPGGMRILAPGEPAPAGADSQRCFDVGQLL